MGEIIMIATMLLLLIFPAIGIWIVYCTIVGLFGKHDNQQNNQSSYHIDSRAKEEDRRINEWGLDDDWRWGRL